MDSVIWNNIKTLVNLLTSKALVMLTLPFQPPTYLLDVIVLNIIMELWTLSSNVSRFICDETHQLQPLTVLSWTLVSRRPVAPKGGSECQIKVWDILLNKYKHMKTSTHTYKLTARESCVLSWDTTVVWWWPLRYCALLLHTPFAASCWWRNIPERQSQRGQPEGRGTSQSGTSSSLRVGLTCSCRSPAEAGLCVCAAPGCSSDTGAQLPLLPADNREVKRTCEWALSQLKSPYIYELEETRKAAK